jgi:cytochrome c553
MKSFVLMIILPAITIFCYGFPGKQDTVTEGSVTSSFTDKAVRDLTAYFEALAPSSGYEAGTKQSKDSSVAQKGAEMVGYLNCGRCHDDGQKGIEFSFTDFSGANLTGANLTGVTLDRVIFCNTIIPDGTINNSGC